MKTGQRLLSESSKTGPHGHHNVNVDRGARITGLPHWGAMHVDVNRSAQGGGTHFDCNTCTNDTF